MSTEKIAANQWKEGVWMVNWQLYYWPDEQRKPDGSTIVHASSKFQCLDSTYELFFTFNASHAEWLLKLIPADNGSDISINCFDLDWSFSLEGNQMESRLSRVTAVNGVELADMPECQGVWGPIKWEHNYTNDAPSLDILYLNNYPQDWPNIQLLLEFEGEAQPSPKTSGELFVLEHLSKLLDTQCMADVQFIVKDEKIGAHSAIVAAGSPVFAAMLQEEKVRDSPVKTIDIEDIEPEVFQQMLRYLYTGVAPLLQVPEITEPLFLAAHKYRIDSLKNQCEIHLMMNLSLDNAVRRLVLAHLYSSTVLSEGAIACLVNHKDHVWTHFEWKDLGKDYPDLFYTVTHRMVTKNTEATLPLL